MMLKQQQSNSPKQFHQTHLGVAVIVLWTVLTACLVVFTSISLYYPCWLKNSRTETVGLDRKCTVFSKCDAGVLDFSNVFTAWWKFAAVLMIVATAVFSVCPAVLFIWLYLRSFTPGRAFVITGCVQIVGAILLTIGCLAFPVGWQSHALHDVCGSAVDVYNAGECRFGWSFTLVILSTFDAYILSGVMFCMMQKSRQSLWQQSLLAEDLWIRTSDS